jgi:small subunit ribosomal protein S6
LALYEHVFLARQDLAQKQVDALAQAATKIIEDNDGKVVKTETWGLRSLAYRIAKNRKAHYVRLEIEGSEDAVAELDRQSQINHDVLRYMTVPLDKSEDRVFAAPSTANAAEPHEAESRGDKVTAGALAGAAVGSVLGLALLPGMGAVIGSAVGAALGAAGSAASDSASD